MVIAVENGLEDISRQLRERGYTIVSYPEYGGVVDAFIYKDSISNSNPSESYQNNGSYQSIENYTSSAPQGVLIINAMTKDIAQIEEILRTRTYSPLF